MNILPEALFQRSTRFHLARAQVLPALEKLRLSPSAVDTLAILGCWWKRS